MTLVYTLHSKGGLCTVNVVQDPDSNNEGQTGSVSCPTYPKYVMNVEKRYDLG